MLIIFAEPWWDCGGVGPILGRKLDSSSSGIQSRRADPTGGSYQRQEGKEKVQGWVEQV